MCRAPRGARLPEQLLESSVPIHCTSSGSPQPPGTQSAPVSRAGSALWGLEGLLSWKLSLLLVRCPLCIQVPLERGVRPECWVAGDPSGPRPQESTQTFLRESCPHPGPCQTQVRGLARFFTRPKMSQWKKKKKPGTAVSGGEINSEI